MRLWQRKQRRLLLANREHDQNKPSFLSGSGPGFSKPIWTWTLTQMPPVTEAMLWIADQALAHRFNLRESGWVQIYPGMHALGLNGKHFAAHPRVFPDRDGRWLAQRLNSYNLQEATAIWKLLPPNYQPLDWQIDFRTGFRWAEKRWSGDLHFGHVDGAEIESPWMLSRFYHAIALAEAYRARHDEKYVAEFENQVLDFIAQNPPRFGVNWIRSSEVSLRAIQWIAAHDLFLLAGAKFSERFISLFGRSLLEHGRFIEQNIPWEPKRRSTAYLASVLGQLTIGRRLLASAEANRWIKHSVRSLVREARLQWRGDGSHVSGKLSIHMEATEMLALAAGIVAGLPKERAQDLFGRFSLAFPKWFWERLWKAAQLLSASTLNQHLVLPQGEMVDDRLLKLDAVYHNVTETSADPRPVIALVNGFFDEPQFKAFAGMDWLGFRWIQSLGQKWQADVSVSRTGNNERRWEKCLLSRSKVAHERQQTRELPLSRPVDLQTLRFSAFSEAGIYSWSAPDLFVWLELPRPDKAGRLLVYDRGEQLLSESAFPVSHHNVKIICVTVTRIAIRTNAIGAKAYRLLELESDHIRICDFANYDWNKDRILLPATGQSGVDPSANPAPLPESNP